MADLRTKALEAYRTVERRAARSGLSREQVSELVCQHTHERVLKAGKEMGTLPPGQSAPTPKQIEAALEAFTVEQWASLIGGLDQSGTAALLAHIRRERNEPKPEHYEWKMERIERRAIMRDTDLWLAEHRDRLVPISDPFWAGFWRDLAREANRVGKGRSANGRSIAELGSNSSIARRLTKRDEQAGREMKVDDREVKRWLEQMEMLRFEQYAADVGADDDEKRAVAFIDYYTMIHKKYQRKN